VRFPCHHRKVEGYQRRGCTRPDQSALDRKLPRHQLRLWQAVTTLKPPLAQAGLAFYNRNCSEDILSPKCVQPQDIFSIMNDMKENKSILIHHPFLKALCIFTGSWIIVLLLLFTIYSAWLREWQMTWGATKEEAARSMAGDELLHNPEFNATRTVEINAPPEKVWPWLVQMGYKRGGLYNFDQLDNGGIPSAECIIPEYQDLKVGDLILPLLQVVQIEPQKSMLWVFLEGAGGWENATWSWALYRTENERTRLVSRLRQKYTSDSIREIMMWRFQEVTEIFMMRTCLLGIKRRAEGNY